MGTLKTENEYIVVDDTYCEFYIPMIYFDPAKSLAKDYVTKINVYGLFPVGIFEGKNFKYTKLFNMPLFIDIFVYDNEERMMDICGTTMKCKVLMYHKGDKLFRNTITQSPKNVAKYVNMLLDGNLPHVIPYPNALDVWNAVLDLNGVGAGVDSATMELILAVQHRNAKAKEQQFNKVIGKDPTADPFSYELASVRQVCQYASTFTSLTFEDFDAMTTSSINKSREGKEEAYTPLEEVIKF